MHDSSFSCFPYVQKILRAIRLIFYCLTHTFNIFEEICERSYLKKMFHMLRIIFTIIYLLVKNCNSNLKIPTENPNA